MNSVDVVAKEGDQADSQNNDKEQSNVVNLSDLKDNSELGNMTVDQFLSQLVMDEKKEEESKVEMKQKKENSVKSLPSDEYEVSSKNSERSTPALNQLIEEDEQDKLSFAPTESVAASITESIISKFTVHSTNTHVGQTSNEHWVQRANERGNYDTNDPNFKREILKMLKRQMTKYPDSVVQSTKHKYRILVQGADGLNYVLQKVYRDAGKSTEKEVYIPITVIAPNMN